MQIRRRNQSLSLIRAVYCPDQGRCRSVTLATVPADLQQVPLALWERLTEPERGQLEKVCARNRQADVGRRRAAHAEGLPEILRQVAAWYRSHPQVPDLAALAEQSRAEWSAVLAAMCEAGVGRRRRRRRG